MLGFYETSNDLTGVAAGTWLMNGGSTTLEGLDALPVAEKIDLLDWVDNLPLYAYAVAEGRPYIMVHAGIRAGIAGAPTAASAGETRVSAAASAVGATADAPTDASAGATSEISADASFDSQSQEDAASDASSSTPDAPGAPAGEGAGSAAPDETAVLVPAEMDGASSEESEPAPLIMGWSDLDLQALLAVQDTDDLLWIRDDFWSRPTGLLDERGQGPIVIAGHTPTPYLTNMADHPDRLPFDENGLGRMVKVGACAETYGIADRWDIDCSAAGGAGFGNILLLRLDDEVEFYEPILEGE
jgi:hypothetical protein